MTDNTSYRMTRQQSLDQEAGQNVTIATKSSRSHTWTVRVAVLLSIVNAVLFIGGVSLVIYVYKSPPQISDILQSDHQKMIHVPSDKPPPSPTLPVIQTPQPTVPQLMAYLQEDSLYPESCPLSTGSLTPTRGFCLLQGWDIWHHKSAFSRAGLKFLNSDSTMLITKSSVYETRVKITFSKTQDDDALEKFTVRLISLDKYGKKDVLLSDDSGAVDCSSVGRHEPCYKSVLRDRLSLTEGDRIGVEVESTAWLQIIYSNAASTFSIKMDTDS